MNWSAARASNPSNSSWPDPGVGANFCSRCRFRVKDRFRIELEELPRFGARDKRNRIELKSDPQQSIPGLQDSRYVRSRGRDPPDTTPRTHQRVGHELPAVRPNAQFQ